jgi:hypothetical protein
MRIFNVSNAKKNENISRSESRDTYIKIKVSYTQLPFREKNSPPADILPSASCLSGKNGPPTPTSMGVSAATAEWNTRG